MYNLYLSPYCTAQYIYQVNYKSQDGLYSLLRDLAPSNIPSVGEGVLNNPLLSVNLLHLHHPSPVLVVEWKGMIFNFLKGFRPHFVHCRLVVKINLRLRYQLPSSPSSSSLSKYIFSVLGIKIISARPEELFVYI